MAMSATCDGEMVHCKEYLFKIFSYLFLAVLGLTVHALSLVTAVGGLSLGVMSWGYSSVVVCGLLTAVVSLVVEYRFYVRGLRSCGAWAQLPHSMWKVPRPGVEPVSPALAGRFLNSWTTREVQILTFWKKVLIHS